MKLFLLYGGNYACTADVDLSFAERGGSVVAKECFANTLPKPHDKVECLIKAEGGSALRFEGCVRAVSTDGDVIVSVHTPLTQKGVEETIKRVKDAHREQHTV